MSKENKIVIKLDDKPNLTALKKADPAKFREVLQTAIAVAEDVANADRSIPYYALPELLHPDLHFSDILPAIVNAFFSVPDIEPDSYSVLGIETHPMARFAKRSIGSNGSYSTWRKHFQMDENAKVDGKTIESIIRRLLYYSRFIDMESFGQAFAGRRLETYKALSDESIRKLPFVPALDYQKEHFGDLSVGRFWDEIGCFYGGVWEEEPEDCPACKKPKLVRLGDYRACQDCNIAIKIEE